MAVWQRPVRVGLASFAVTFGAALLYNMSDRAAPPAVPADAAVDPNAVIESRGARITLGDGSMIVADRQFVYDDGSARLLGVEVIVPAGEDRTGFRIRGGEAAGVEETGEWRLAGTVKIETEDGLTGSAAEASYADASGVVTMPEPARFEQGWMRLAGDAARYDRRRGLVHLDRQAIVELLLDPDGGAPGARIAAGRAEVDRLAGSMRFTETVTVDVGGSRMHADTVVIRFDPDASRMEAIELRGGARVLGQDDAETALRVMSAQTISMTYREAELERAELAGGARILGSDAGPGRLRDLSAPQIAVGYRDGAPERATMTGGARVELSGDRPGAAGVAIAGGAVELVLEAGAAGIDELHAQERVTLAFPPAEGVVRRVRAPALDIGSDGATDPAADGTSGGGLAAVFGGGVELRESDVSPASAADDRVMRADRLEATLGEGMARLADTRFLGNVTLQAGGISAEADEATYAPDEALFTLLTADPDGRPPRMDDQRGFLQAGRIAIGLDGPNIEAMQEVKGVLGSTEAGASPAGVRPGLFAAGAPIHFVAGRFAYDAAQSLATYGAGARLRQESTEFRGQTIVIDETTGDITADGSVRTRTTMLQNDSELEDTVEAVTEGGAGNLFYDNQKRLATYTTDAVLSSPRFTLGSETIALLLHDDARTLDRIEAAVDVTLELDIRTATGDTLTYEDRDGRYDLAGEPVLVIEQMEEECRETTGRTVTFYANGESISFDGQSAERTASSAGGC